MIKSINSWLDKQKWYEPARRAFWSRPDRQIAIKATIAIALVFIPFMLEGEYFIATTLALGVLAGALSETDDHPQGRIKALLIKVSGFALSSLAVGLLRDYTILLGIGLGVSCIFFILIGGLSERFKGITFGAILVGIYAMQNVDDASNWYSVALYLTAGALFQGVFSLFLLYLKPYRLLEEQLARGFQALARYQKEKASLFIDPSNRKSSVGNDLAMLNIKMVEALDRCRAVLRSYADIEGDNEKLREYFHYFMILQSLHERAASTYEYKASDAYTANEKEIQEGVAQVFYLLGDAYDLFAYSLLVGIPYKHPTILNWSIKALEEKQALYNLPEGHPLYIVVYNLIRSNDATKRLNGDGKSPIIPRLAKDDRSYWERLKEQLSFQHPRMRHAIRLALCMTICYAVSEFFRLEEGDWIVLTSLMVCQSSFSETRRRFFQRVVGTISGVVLGVLVIQLIPTVMGQVIFLLCSAYYFFFWLKRRYSYAVVFITTFVLCLFNIVAGSGVVIMGPRLIDTLIGAIITIVIVRFVWPDWQYKRIPNLLNVAFDKNASYLKKIIDAHIRELGENDYDYRLIRREAHRADNALAQAWQNMRFEPKKQQQLHQHSLKLTYLNHALISYFSALGLYRQSGLLKKAGLINLANEILQNIEAIHLPLPKDISDNKERIEQIIIDLYNSQKNAEPMVVQQARILTNIAELNLKLLKHAKAYDYLTVED